MSKTKTILYFQEKQQDDKTVLCIRGISSVGMSAEVPEGCVDASHVDVYELEQVVSATYEPDLNRFVDDAGNVLLAL